MNFWFKSIYRNKTKKMTNARFGIINVAIIFGIIVSILSLVAFINTAIVRYDQVNSKWQTFNDSETQIVKAALKLNAYFGYGGMIHHFKNYVIRGDKYYLQALEIKLKNVGSELDELSSYLNSEKELAALHVLEKVLKEYTNKIIIIGQMHDNMDEISAIDKAVKINDQDAIAALETIRSESNKRSSKVRISTNELQKNSHDFLLLGWYLIFPIVLTGVLIIYYIRKVEISNKSIALTLKWADNILDAAPEAIIISNIEGEIVRVNQLATTLFGYSTEEFIKINVEQLLPNKSVTDHKKLRRDFFDNSNNRQMAEARRVEAITKDGRKFFVEIGINLVQTQEKDVVIATVRDITERVKAEEKISYQANYDYLTGLPNRFQSINCLEDLLEKARIGNKKVAVIFFDLDDFKKVNDTLGHDFGDQLLIEAAKRLNKFSNNKGIVGRLGGDEFIILLDDIENKKDLKNITCRILKEFHIPFQINSRQLTLTTSAGIAIYPEDGLTSSTLLRNADSAMYYSKEQGRNKFFYFDNSMNERVVKRLSIEEQLLSALSNKEFEVYYQPKVASNTKSIVGVEALLRWNNPVLGNVSPDDFIPVAEHTGLIIPLGKYVLEESLRSLKQWRDSFSKEFHVAVNISPNQFRDTGLYQFIKDSLIKYELPSDSLELEITEGVLLFSNSGASEILNEFRALGIKLSMDDFGTGYSSLSYLKEYPFDIVKIDRSFVKDMETDADNAKLVAATVMMGHSLNLKVVAEGVENVEQFELLKAMGCDYIQGYFFSRPVTVDVLNDMLKVVHLDG